MIGMVRMTGFRLIWDLANGKVMYRWEETKEGASENMRTGLGVCARRSKGLVLRVFNGKPRSGGF